MNSWVNEDATDWRNDGWDIQNHLEIISWETPRKILKFLMQNERKLENNVEFSIFM